MSGTDLRPGQAAWNTLRLVRPDIADRIHGTAADPFYDSTRLPVFWNAVQHERNKENE